MQFLCDTRPLREAFFEAEVEPAGQLVQPEAIHAQRRQRARQHTGKAEPPRLPEQWFDFKSHSSLAAVPKPVGVAGDHAESIRTRVEIGINSFACRHRLAPVTIESVESI